MLAAPRFGASGLRRTYISRQSVVIAESYLRHRRRGAASSVLQQSSALATDRQTGRTRTARQIVDLVQRGFSEPPLITKREEKYSQEEIEFAIFRLRRKLRRFLLHRRTAMKLEAMWDLYVEIKRMSDWRINTEQLDQFLRAILRNGERTEWCSRAEQLLVELSERTEEVDPAIYMSLLRVYAKFGDIQRFEHAAKTAMVKLGPAWTAEQSDFVETRVVAYARAGMPAQGEQIMEDAFGATDQPVRALRELLLSWTRNKDVDRAWAKMSELLKIGMGKGTREWNALLHMHAVDLRYRYELVEQVLGRMRKAGAECDQVTYNIMMHACLLRGKQVLWKDWYKRMEQAEYAPDVYTYTALVSQLVNNGQWGEALNIIKHMRTSNIQPTAATSVAVMSMERKRGHARNIMGKFRQSVLKGASISVNEFTSVMSTALENPRQWATEIALIIRCLEEGLVGESAVVDALAARLPGLNSSRLSSRPLVSLLHQDAVAVGAVIEEGLQNGNKEPQIAAGSRRKSFPETLNVVIRTLLRNGHLQQAESLISTARDANIELSSPYTLLQILYYSLRSGSGPSTAGGNREKIEHAHYVPPTILPSTLLIHYVKANNFDAARTHYDKLEQLVDNFPSVHAFNAMLMYASATSDIGDFEMKWRQMDARGVLPNAVSHQTRLFCYSKSDDLLKTRRAYTDMLDYGYLPTFPAVSAVVRCCVRSRDIKLAQTIIRHAERECNVALNTTTYNYVLMALADRPWNAKVVRKLFRSMLMTSDARLCSPIEDNSQQIEAEKRRFVDLRVLESEHTRLGSWLMRPSEERTSSSRLRRALVNWLTSRAAFSAAPSLTDLHNVPRKVSKGGKKNRKAHAATTQDPQQQRNGNAASAAAPVPAPPPDATTFIILLRAYGKQGQWSAVLHVWDALLAFNKRVDRLAVKHPYAATYRISPFSRMVGWVALALVNLGQAAQARELWETAKSNGVLGESVRDIDMMDVLQKLMSEKVGTRQDN